MELYVVNKFGNAFKARFIEVNDEGKATDMIWRSDDDIHIIDMGFYNDTIKTSYKKANLMEALMYGRLKDKLLHNQIKKDATI